MTAWTLLIIAALTAVGFFVGRARAQRLRNAGTASLHSLPTYHGLLMASMALAAASVTTLAVALVAGSDSMIMPAAAALLGTGAIAASHTLITRDFRARNRFEYFVKLVLIACSAVAVLTTIGIVFSVLFESLAFFREVSPLEFLFGTHWSPTSTPASFGFIPLLVGSLLITFIAVLVAGPLGLLSAIYMAEYSSRSMRGVLKPMLEILAGVPTVVLGFFAALTVAPLIRNAGESLGLSVASESALAAGLAVRTAHQPVNGRSERGKPYSAICPEMAACVHNVLAESFLVAFQTFAPQPLTRGEAVSDPPRSGARSGLVFGSPFRGREFHAFRSGLVERIKWVAARDQA